MRAGDEKGTALVEVTWLAILLMIPLLYIMLAAFEVQRSAYAVSAAASAAGRAYSLAPDEATGHDRARAAAALALADQGVSADGTSLEIRCAPDPGNCLAPGSTIRVLARSAVDLPLMPAALGGNTPRIRVDAVHDVPYGTFREDR